MSMYTARVQSVLTPYQHAAMQELSKKSKTPISVLIRQAIEQVYFEPIAQKRRLNALDQLLSLDAPVADWEQMEAEIVQGAVT